MSATSERDLAIHLAKTDFNRALSLARNVSRPWFRCQALAFAARFAPDAQVLKVANEAIDAALASDNPYDISATAWPLRALIERNQTSAALKFWPTILASVARIEPPVSRGDALFLLWQAWFIVGGKMRESVTSSLFLACREHPQGHRLLRQATLILASEDFPAAQRFAELIPVGKYRRQAVERLAQGWKIAPRRFFDES